MALCALGFALGLNHHASSRIPAALVLVAGCAVVGLLVLGIIRYEWAVMLGFVLFGVVRWQPAPSDAVFAIVIAIAIATGRFNLRRVPLPVTVLVGGFLGLNILSSVEVISLSASLLYTTTTFYLAAFALWLPSYAASPQRMTRVARGYLIAAIASAALGIVALTTHVGPGLLTSSNDLSRAQALFKDPNVYGPFLIPMALIMTEELLFPRLFAMRRALKVAILFLLSIGTVISYSRAAWISYALGLLIMVVVYTFRRGAGRKALGLLLLIVCIVAGLTITTAATGSTRFLESRTHLQSYDQGRFATQHSGLDLALRYPMGVGPGQFDVIEPRSSHSTYVRIIAEQGVPGFLLVVCLLLLTLMYATRNAVLGYDSYGIGSAPLLGAWCGLLVNSTVVDTNHWRHLWLIAALVWIGEARRLATVRRQGPPVPVVLRPRVLGLDGAHRFGGRRAGATANR
jgi:O-antigen ligase